MAKKKKIDEARNMVERTYRDLGQDYIMKGKMVRAIIIAIITFIALVVFIALYIDETRRVQETYRTQFRVNLKEVVSDIESYQNAEGDLEFRYMRIVSDMNTAASFAFLLDAVTEEQKKVTNELYTVFLKYPVQMKERLEEAKNCIMDMQNDMDKGFEEAKALVEAIDKKGY